MRLSTRQEKLLIFVHHHMTVYGFSPTIREIGNAIGTNSTSVVSYNINQLVRKEYLSKTPEKSRTTALTDKGLAVVKRTQSAKKCPAPMINAELERLRAENHLLKLEIEHLREGNNAKLVQLQREVLMLTDKVRELQR